MWNLKYETNEPIYEKRQREKKKNHYSDIRVGSSRKLSPEELMLLNCGVGEDS